MNDQELIKHILASRDRDTAFEAALLIEKREDKSAIRLTLASKADGTYRYIEFTPMRTLSLVWLMLGALDALFWRSVWWFIAGKPHELAEAPHGPDKRD